MEIQANNGGFVQVLPAAGYPKHFRTTSGGGSPFTGPMPGIACYAGTLAWSTQFVDLANYEGDTIQVRFRFGSDSGTGREGWYVDDVQIRGEAPVIPSTPPDSVSDVVIQPLGTDVKLDWTPSTGATYYVIYRNSDGGFIAGPTDSIGFTADSTYTDVGISASTIQNFYIIKAVR